MTSVALSSFLQSLLLLGSALTALKLYTTGLYKKYPVFFFYFVFRIPNNLSPLVLDFRSNTYFFVYLATLPIMLLFYVLMVRELYRLVLEDYRISVPQVRIQWAGAQYDDADRMGLLALASALSLSRFASDGHLTTIGVTPPTSLGRLTRLLVNDRQLATNVIVDNYDSQQSGIFEIAVFPRPGASLTLIETLVDSVVASLATNPITKEEIAMFNSYNRVYLPTTLQPRFMRADTLAHDEIFAGDPSAYARQATAAQKLTPADLDRVARRFLVPGRSVLSIVPAGKLDLISKPNAPYTNVTPPFALKRP